MNLKGALLPKPNSAHSVRKCHIIFFPGWGGGWVGWGWGKYNVKSIQADTSFYSSQNFLYFNYSKQTVNSGGVG